MIPDNIDDMLDIYSSCRLCPWECGVNRFAGERGRCKCGAEAIVSDYMPHFGEESCLVGERGSGAIFFAHCNLSCVFCQTANISQRGEGTPVSTEKLAEIMFWLQDHGCHNLNLITPTHVIPSIMTALAMARERGFTLPVVYNSGGYELVETLKKLKGFVDIYLPDFKFWNGETAEKLCGAGNYPEVARKAIKEMHDQVGDLKIDARTGIAVRGLLVRHLVLPGYLHETRKILEFISKEISPETHVNIMGHYRPFGDAKQIVPINRSLKRSEFRAAVETAEAVGLSRLDKTHWHLYDFLFEQENKESE